MLKVIELEQMNIPFYKLLQKSIIEVKHDPQEQTLKNTPDYDESKVQNYSINLTEKEGRIAIWRDPVILVLKHGKSIGYFEKFKQSQSNFNQQVPARQKQIQLEIIQEVICQQNILIIKFKEGLKEVDWRFHYYLKHLNQMWAKILVEQVRKIKLKRMEKESVIIPNLRFVDKRSKKTITVENLKEQNSFLYLSYSNKVNVIEKKQKIIFSIADKIGKSGWRKKQAIIVLRCGDSIGYFYECYGVQINLEIQIPSCRNIIIFDAITKVEAKKNVLCIYFQNAKQEEEHWEFKFMDENQSLAEE